MSFFSRLFNRSDGSNNKDTSGDEKTLTCDCCGCEVDESDMEEGQCPECYGSEYTGPKYCCGMIYEEGEDTCASCGESL
jgi:hypothetical protein